MILKKMSAWGLHSVRQKRTIRPMKRPTFRQWLTTLGDEKAAEQLGITERSAKGYRLGERIPRLKDVPLLIQKTGGRLNADSFIRDFQ